jgi:hypothetical protein
MTQLNSSFQTALQRRYLPVVISLILIGVLGAIVAPPAPPVRVIVSAVVILALVALAYFCVYRAVVSRAADRVVLDGGLLHVTRGRQDAAIPVESITAIHSRTGISPETITLDLATETEIGRSITFIPPVRFPSGREHPILVPLRATMRRSA